MEYFKLVSQIGGPTAAKVVTPHLYELQQLLSKHCYNKYSTQLDEFAPVLRVDGDISYWEFEGCEKLRLAKKHRYITLDIGMPKSKWEGQTSKDIRQYLLSNLEDAMHLIVKKLRKEKMDLAEDLLLEDFNKVKKEFVIE